MVQKFCPDYELLFELHTLPLATRSYVLLIYIIKKVESTSLASSLKEQQGLPQGSSNLEDFTQAQSSRSSVEKKLQARQRQEYKATQQEDAKLQVKVPSHF